MRITYFVHDLTDPAVKRRVRMFQQGGATVILAGFRRGAVPEQIDGIEPIVLGVTADARFISRMLKVGNLSLRTSRLQNLARNSDVIVARNLEMLVLGSLARDRRNHCRLVYECLDIHRLLLSRNIPGIGLRSVEGFLAQRADLLLTSSPSFIENYFQSRSQVRLPWVLVENKVLLDDLPSRMSRPVRQGGAPWRIGWFGALRCIKSFRMLAALTRTLDGRVHVVLRGRPAETEFPDLASMVAAEPFMRFEGPYRNPEDLLNIYGEVDFAWAIDFFEEGLNSEWLLPNRLYESGCAGAIPIARERTATGQWLKDRHVGVTVSDDVRADLDMFYRGLDEQRMSKLCSALDQVDHADWTCSTEECRALVQRLAA